MLSIIIPVYNRAHLLPRTLDSISRQTARDNIELILIDNGSSDDSPAVMRRFADDNRRRFAGIIVLSESKSGAAAARNTGLRHATGERIMFFDSDDTMEPTLTERVLAVTGEWDIIMWRREIVAADGKRAPLPLKRRDLIANHLLHSNMATQAWAASRAFLNAARAWNEQLPAWNDYEYGLRLLLRHPKVVFLDGSAAVTVYHSGAQSITGTGFSDRHGYWESVLNLMEEEINAADETADTRLRLSRLINFKRLTLAASYEAEHRPDLAAPLLTQSLAALPHKALMRLLFNHIARGRRGAAALARVVL